MERLRMIREEHKPIRIEELREHSEACEKFVAEAQERYRSDRANKFLSSISNFDTNKLETKANQKLKHKMKLERFMAGEG